MIVTARRHLYLAGFMGTGKTVTGEILASMLSRPFYDLDLVVEQMTNRSVSEVFSAEGETGFRNREWCALRSIVGGSASVIALGGGAPTIAPLRTLVQESGRTVLLTSELTVMWDRLHADQARPLLRGGDGDSPKTITQFTHHVKPMLAAREGVYREVANLMLDTSKVSPEGTARQILDWYHAQTS